MKTSLVAAKAVVFGSGFLLVWGWVALRFRRLDPLLGGALGAWARWPGVVLMIAGGALGVACVVDFVVRGSGTPAPFDPPKKFVAAGPYRKVRNPMYIGGIGLLAGFGLYLRSPAILLLAAIFLLLSHVFVTRVEEPGLRKKFGAAYEEYLKSVPRWLPKR
ncbi:MAG: isoprenylcysteine carboxylmethyltransferase family protein [Acidobacteriota bacterium]|nr:isoprenylcysteine carboxylmethyltransferase family protein [Acidobacteriota bacterium]